MRVPLGVSPRPDGLPCPSHRRRAFTLRPYGACERSGFLAIYHLSAKVMSRSAGRSSVAAAAYRSGSELTNQRDGIRHDYSRRRDVVHAEILAPANAPEWMSDRAQLWNAVEVVERRKDAQLARELEIALPRELDQPQQLDLVREFAREQFVSKGMIADIAIHNPSASDGHEQPHAHVMLTMREITGQGFGNKNRDWNGKDHLEGWREAWAGHANRALERAGQDERVDHRSLAKQQEEALNQGRQTVAEALDREPQTKIGLAAAGMEQRGQVSERGEMHREIAARNAERRSLREQLEQVRTALRQVVNHLREQASRLVAAVSGQTQDGHMSAAERIEARAAGGGGSGGAESDAAKRIADRSKELPELELKPREMGLER